MRLSVKLRLGRPDHVLALARAAEDLGYYGVWVNEPWGYDVGGVIGWLAGQTKRIMLGTHIVSVYSRTPAAIAGLAATLQEVSRGRFRLGLGTSGPQVVEGWHGVRFADPIGRTRDTVQIVRLALSSALVTYSGTSVSLPLPGGQGKALRFRNLDQPLDVPIYLAAMGPRNVRLAAELATGWSPFPYAPEAADVFAKDVAVGSALRSLELAPLECVPSAGLAFERDGFAARDAERKNTAFHLGAMGSAKHNFYVDAATRMGFGTMAHRVQELWLSGDHDRARAEVTDSYIDATSLVGSPLTIQAGLHRHQATGTTELVLEPRQTDIGHQIADLRDVWSMAGQGS